MRDIFTIVIRLTLSCLLAGLIMGITFVLTNKAKEHNQHINEQKVSLALLGFSGEQAAPDSMILHDLYRYIITENDNMSIGYLLPLVGDQLSFVRIDLAGKLIEQSPVQLDDTKIGDEGVRHEAISAALGAGKDVAYVEKAVVVTDGGQRVAYLVGGKFTGFKTFIDVMLAVGPEYQLLGFEVMEHEEDPGLGGEIEQDYFKNQFKDKPFEILKRIDVVKAPIPDDYYAALVGKVEGDELMSMMEKYRGNDIYALTGATISTKAVSDGVKGIVRKFAYRIGVLDAVLKEQNIEIPF